MATLIIIIIITTTTIIIIITLSDNDGSANRNIDAMGKNKENITKMETYFAAQYIQPVVGDSTHWLVHLIQITPL